MAGNRKRVPPKEEKGDKSKRRRRGKIETEIEGGDQVANVNKATETDKRTRNRSKSREKAMNRTNEEQGNVQDTAEQESEEVEGIIKSAFNEDDQLMEMEVQAGQDEFLSEEIVEIPNEVLMGDESDDSEDEADQASNNNAQIDNSEAETEEEAEEGEKAAKSSHRLSVTERDAIMSEAYNKAMSQMQQCVQQAMNQSGFLETAQLLQEQLEKGTYVSKDVGRKTTINIRNQAQTKGKSTVKVAKTCCNSGRVLFRIDSKVTIYKNAVPNEIGKRGSSSSEDDWLADTSDELAMNDVQNEINDIHIDETINDLIAERRQIPPTMTTTSQNREPEPVPSTSGWRRDRDNQGQERQATRERERQPMKNHKERGEEIVRDAEAHQAQIFDVTGKPPHFDLQTRQNELRYQGQVSLESEFVHSALVDENYMLVAAHLDEAIQRKIVRGEYIDLARLLPRDKIVDEEDDAMQIVIKDGQTFWKPAKNCGHDVQVVNSIYKWE